MTPAKDFLLKRIRDCGPVTVAEYMTICLTHPEFGYYTTRNPLGTAGDFVTAPEISQMFGELLGLALVQAWMDHGAPARFNLVELGPGRGTLMADVLRAARAAPAFGDAAQLHLVETSPVLRRAQNAAINQTITHHYSVQTLPEGPLYVLANEFFDALPVRQFVRDGNAWRERVIGLDGKNLAFGLTGPCQPDSLLHRLADTKSGDLVEVSSACCTVMAEIGDRIANFGGAGIIVDYGNWRSLGDTFQAVQGHATVDALADPGNADLTAHVDFEALAKAAAPAHHSKLTPQGVFLERLGITDRANALSALMQGQQLEAHISAHRRLTHPEEMGNLFKVLGIHAPDSSPIPGVST